MATDELTAETIQAIRPLEIGTTNATRELLCNVCDSHELLRAERDALREELKQRDEEDAVVIPETGAIIERLERELAEARKEADDYHRMYDESTIERDRWYTALRDRDQQLVEVRAERFALREQLNKLKHALDPQTPGELRIHGVEGE